MPHVSQLKKAIVYLEQLLSADDKNGLKLPPLTKLARSAQVSLVTMQKAVTHLVKRDRLFTLPGKGIYKGAAPKVSQVKNMLSLQPGTSWERISQIIESDILSNRFGREYLPNISELTHTYACCYRTIIKALKVLIDRGVLVKENKRYRLPDSRSQEPANTIVLIARRQPQEKAMKTGSIFFNAIRFLEEECLHRNLRLHYVGYHYTGPYTMAAETNAADILDNPGSTSILGFIVLGIGMWHLDSVTLLKKIEKHNKPIAVFDPDGYIAEHKKTIRFKTPDTYTAGYEVGSYLLKKGHHKVAYISPRQDHPWSTGRLDGFKQAFFDRGFPEGVISFCEKKPFKNLHEKSVNKIRRRVLKRCLPSPDPIEQLFGRSLQELKSAVQDSVQAIAWSDRTRVLLEQALTQGGFSAIAAENDLAALSCLKWLSEKNIQVPEQFSLISFDDSFDAFSYNLTSYNFGYRKVYSAIVTTLLNSQHYNSKQSKTYYFSGSIMERGSSKPGPFAPVW